MCLSRLFNPYHCSSSPTFSELDRRFANMDDQVLDSEENKNANKARNVKNSDDLLEQVFPKHVVSFFASPLLSLQKRRQVNCTAGLKLLY